MSHKLSLNNTFFTVDYAIHRPLYSDYLEFYHNRITGSILLDEVSLEVDEQRPDVKVGSFTGYILDLGDGTDAGYEMFDLFDSCSDTRDFHAFVFVDDEDAKEVDGIEYDINPRLVELFDIDWVNRILILHTVEIEEAYRGFNLGLAVTTQIIRDFGRGCDLVMMKAFPMQYSGDMYEKDQAGEYTKTVKQDFLTGQKKLIQHWCQLGFQPIDDSGILALTQRCFEPYYLPYL
jgi:hypothetical protein